MPVKCGITDTLRLNLKNTAEMTPEELETHKASREATIADLNEIMGAIDRGDPVKPGDLQHAAMLAAAVSDKVRSIEGRFGKDARPGAVAGGDVPIAMKDVVDFGEKLADTMPEAKLYAKLASLEPFQQEQWLANMWRGRKANGSLYTSLYLAAKLSNPWTVGKAVVGHTAALPTALMDRFFAERWGASGLFGDDRYMPGEAAVGAMSFWTNMQDQLKLLSRQDWDGIHTQMVTEGEYHPPVHMPDNMFGNIVNAVAGAPGYALGAQRASFGTITRMGALDMAAYRQAMKDAAAQGLDRDGMLKLQEQYRRAPSPEMLREAQDMRDTYTYTKNLSGLLGSAQKAVQGDVGKVLVDPFPKVSTNMLDVAWDHLPGIALAKAANWADLKAGGRRAQMVLAKQTTGLMVLGTGLTLGLAGLVTGEGPSDPRARKIWEDSGWRKNYVYNPFTGEPMVSHEALGPMSGLLSMVGDMAFILRHADQMTTEAMVGSAALALSEPFSRAGYVEAWGEVVGALKDGLATEQWVRMARERIEGLGIVLTPGAANFARDLMDPDKKPARTTGRGDFLSREWKNMKDDVTAAWPGWADGMPQQRNFMTDEAIPRDGAAPWYKTVTGDVVAKELFRLGANQGGQRFSVLAPPSDIGGGQPVRGGLQMTPESAWARVPLDAWEKDRLIQFLTSIKQPAQFGNGNVTLYQALQQTIESREYKQQKDGPEGGKAQMLNKTYRGYLLTAERMLLEEDKHLAWLVAQKRVDQANASSPQGAPTIQNPLGAEPKPTEYPRPGQKER